MKRRITGLVFLFLFSILNDQSLSAQQIEPKLVVVKAARLLDVRTGTLMAQPVVVIEGERITIVGANSPIPANAEVIDLGQKTLVPGLIDCHT
ncbi:MAG TPA: amidohydrolase family protein, partial [Blastocatellia bacterium]|nr:amidohydrolase family protein [Blastocatellia bacterium]